MILSQSLSASGLRHLNFSAPNPNPLRRGRVGCAVYLIRQQVILVLRQLFFCHLFCEVSGTSACVPVAYLPCRTLASPLIKNLNINTSLNISPLLRSRLCCFSCPDRSVPFLIPRDRLEGLRVRVVNTARFLMRSSIDPQHFKPFIIA